MAATQLKHKPQQSFTYTTAHIECINTHMNSDKEQLSTKKSVSVIARGLHAHT